MIETDDTGERYHVSDRAHKTPNAMTTHELSLVLSKKKKREIRLKRSMPDPKEMETPTPGPSAPSADHDQSSPSTDDSTDPPPKLHPYTDKMDNT